MQGDRLRKQLHVSGGEFARKAHFRCAIAFGEPLALEAATHEPLELRSRIAGDACQIAHQHALVGAAKLAIRKTPKYSGDEAVTFAIIADGLEFDFKGSLQKSAQLLHRIEPCLVH